MSEETVSIDLTAPELPSTHSSVVPVVIGIAIGIGATFALNKIVDKLKKADVEEPVVVIEETPKVD